MQERFTHKRYLFIVAMVLLALVVSSCRGGLRERLADRGKPKGSDACDQYVAAINSGYGSNGSYKKEMKTLANDRWDGEPVSVFFPVGFNGKAPVVFFSHAYGGSDWQTGYPPLIENVVSRGAILIYSPYPTFRATIPERYEILWRGFELAVKTYGDHMDLSRVGFAGHSFGGGATPNMAWRGLVQNGWGAKGAFMFSMAPWYSYNMDSQRFNAYPAHVVQMVQIYQADTINDHRMAIDIFRNTGLPAKQKFFSYVHTRKVSGCEIIPDHATPARNPSLRLKQYAVFRPFDALMDYAFNGNRDALAMLNGQKISMAGNFQPLSVEGNPTPEVAESNYMFKWDSDKNPRISKESW